MPLSNQCQSFLFISIDQDSLIRLYYSILRNRNMWKLPHYSFLLHQNNCLAVKCWFLFISQSSNVLYYPVQNVLLYYKTNTLIVFKYYFNNMKNLHLRNSPHHQAFKGRHIGGWTVITIDTEMCYEIWSHTSAHVWCLSHSEIRSYGPA